MWFKIFCWKIVFECDDESFVGGINLERFSLKQFLNEGLQKLVFRRRLVENDAGSWSCKRDAQPTKYPEEPFHVMGCFVAGDFVLGLWDILLRRWKCEFLIGRVIEVWTMVYVRYLRTHER